jgi:hypothetical protein
MGGNTHMTRSRSASGLLVSAIVSGLFVAAPAVSAYAAPTDCPTAFPTAQAVDGVTGTGYTVERGTLPDSFSAHLLGRITDGVGPGVDMIMAQLDSPALTRAGGVWAGMSGSPVYTSDGRLIGSVSYGLAASSTIAGITPAQDMMTLLGSPAVAPAGASKIKVSSRQALRIARTGEVSRATAAGGFTRLAVPVSVSGVPGSSTGGTKFLKHLTKASGLQVRTGGSRIRAAASDPSEITAGSNFAAALSYGDVSISGVGTTTFVCDGQAVAFGHPFFNTGAVEYTAHPATAVLIQPDPVNGPFKVANPGGPVGVIKADKTLGLRAELGATPTATFPVTSSLVPDGGAAVTGTTVGVYQPWAGDISALHLQANILKALGAEGPGSAALTFTIKGTRSNGKAFTLTRSDHYSDSSDVAYAAADELYLLVSSLADQEFDSLKITSVNVTGTVSSTVRQYRVTGVQVKKKGKWVTQKGVLRVTSGKLIPTRLTLTKYRSSATVKVPLTIKVPAGMEGAVGDLLISDGYDAGLGDADGSSNEPTTLTQLLAQLATLPPNDAVAGTLTLDNGVKAKTTVTLKKTNATVSEYAKDISLQVKF